MSAFGNHLRMANVENRLEVTNLGVAIMFEQECQSHSNDLNAMVAIIVYVGWIKEILELDYGNFQTIVFFCNWVVANYKGFVATMTCDKYGFTIVNVECLIPLSTKSFIFLMHIEQVFFSSNVRQHGN
jgi:hypothetical protein